MVINDLYIIGNAIVPFEANPPPIIDADTILSGSISLQFF
jgi:hypothetical protein